MDHPRQVEVGALDGALVGAARDPEDLVERERIEAGVHVEHVASALGVEIDVLVQLWPVTHHGG